MKKEHCRCSGPYTCREHDGEFKYCDNSTCKCHSEARQEGGGWRERFDQLNKKIKLREETVSGVDEYGLVRNFIEAELKAAEERARREVVKLLDEYLSYDEETDTMYFESKSTRRIAKKRLTNDYEEFMGRLNGNEGEANQ